MSRERHAIGNWKMNPGSVAAAVRLAADVDRATRGLDRVSVTVAPPYVALAAVRGALAESHVRVGAQDLHEEERGAFTAGVSAEMLAELVELVIVGHSEVRRDRGDTDARVNAKLRRAFRHGLAAVLCVGESLEVRRGGGAESFVREQLRVCLEGLAAAEVARVTLAYEPIWAIGTGVPATGEDARRAIAALREEIRARYDNAVAERVPILYGGSVTGETIREFAGQDGIDGALVGGASLVAEEFGRIARSIAEAS